MVVWCRGLDRRSNLQQLSFAARRRDQLQPHRQAIGRETGRDRDRWTFGGGDDTARHHPAEIVRHRDASDLGRVLLIGGERGDLGGRQGKNIDLAEEFENVPM